jgi:hypothetical protein
MGLVTPLGVKHRDQHSVVEVNADFWVQSLLDMI